MFQKTIDDILIAIEGNHSFTISSHINPDMDAVGSQIALYLFLTELGKTATIINRDPMPENYRFLPRSDAYQVVNQDTVCKQEVDVVFVLDCGSLSRIGDSLERRFRAFNTIINIDHHLSNDYFGTYNLVDVNACATAELIFRLIKAKGLKVGYERAICLYSAILTDTGSFRYKNTNSESHRIAAELIDEGVEPDKIAEMIYNTIPYKKAKLFGLTLDSLRLSDDNNVAWVSVTKDMFSKTDTSASDTEEFIDYIRSIKGIKVAILFRENEDGSFKVSLRSRSNTSSGNISVDKIASLFGGGGHSMAAGCNVPGPLEEAVRIILKAVNEHLSTPSEAKL